MAPLHTRFFEAAVALGPATTLIAVKSEVGNVKTHWSAAGWVPIEVRDRSRLMVDPTVELPEARESETGGSEAKSDKPAIKSVTK